MARARSAESGSYYAWSDLYHGGETEEREASGNKRVKVVLSRDITPRGEKVSQADLGVTDEEFQALVDSGSVRPYPLPEGADEYTSPHKAVMDQLVTPEGDVDINKVLELGNLELVLNPEVTNPPAEEGKELPAGA